MTIAPTSNALPQPRAPLATAPREGLAQSSHVADATATQRRNMQVARLAALGGALEAVFGIDDVQVDGLDNLRDVPDSALRCLIVSHALDPQDAIVMLGSGLRAARDPVTQDATMLCPLMRRGHGLQAKLEALMMDKLGITQFLTFVQTPGTKHLEGEALAEARRQNLASLAAGKERIARIGGVQVIFPQGNVRGPGAIHIAAVGAIKAFSQYEGLPTAFITAGLTYEPLVPQGAFGPVRARTKAFLNFGRAVVLHDPASDDASLARSLELELAKVHTWTASGIAGAYVFSQRAQGKQPTLFENEFKTLVTQCVDNLRPYPDVYVDRALQDRATRDATLHGAYQTMLARGFTDAFDRAVRHVGPAADFAQAPKDRADANTYKLALHDPLRFNGNRVCQVMRDSAEAQGAFDAAARMASGRLSRARNQPQGESDALRDACAVM